MVEVIPRYLVSSILPSAVDGESHQPEQIA